MVKPRLVWAAARSRFSKETTGMTRVSVFSSPLLLGFDHIERVLDRVNKTAAEGYPPYNIEQTGEHRLRITLAVAGFADEDLAVSVEDNQLVIRGKQQEDCRERIYLHRGIAARQFTRSFVLAEGIEVRGAEVVNGLLHVDLERPVPQPKVTQIEIRNSAGKKKAAQKTIDVDPNK
jgi:HSP20 family molecular chaperone IbpA